MNYVISSGTGTYHLQSGDQLFVLSGGESSNSVVSGGATETVVGRSEDDTVKAGGELVLVGAASGDSILSGGDLLLSNSPTATGVTVFSGGTLSLALNVSAGETVSLEATVASQTRAISGVTVDAGGRAVLGAGVVSSGGVLSLGTAAFAQGVVTVSFGGVVEGGVLAQAAGFSIDFGLISGAQLGDADPPLPGGSEREDLNVSSGGRLVEASLDDADVIVSSDGRVSNTSVIGGDLDIAYGGAATAILVEAGGELTVSSAGSAISTTVMSGGQAGFANGADLSGTLIEAGGTITQEGGTLSRAHTAYAGVITARSSFSGVILSSGANLEYSGLDVLSGALLSLGAGADVASATIAPGARAVGTGAFGGENYGIVSGAVVTAALDDHSGGEVISVTVASHAVLAVAGGIASDVRLDPEGRLGFAGGLVESITVCGGATISALIGDDVISKATILSGGVITGGGTPIQSGVILEGLVLDYGSANGLAVSNGQLDVLSGGAAVGDYVFSGGVVDVFSGASAADLTPQADARIVDNGAIAYAGETTIGGALSGSGLIAADGATLVLSDAGLAFSGAVSIDDGGVELALSGALGAAKITFGPDGGQTDKLELTTASQPASGTTFKQTLVDFGVAGDSLDLVSRTYVSGATATLIGDSLRLVDGKYVVRFTLSGAPTTSFTVTSDGAGGTLIQPAAVAQSIAAFSAEAAPLFDRPTAPAVGRPPPLVAVAPGATPA